MVEVPEEFTLVVVVKSTVMFLKPPGSDVELVLLSNEITALFDAITALLVPSVILFIAPVDGS